MKKLLPLFFILLPAIVWAQTVRVLSYDSMLGKKSFGEFLSHEFPKFCAGCTVEFQSGAQVTGLLGKVRADVKRHKKLPYDVVMGFDSHQYQWARAESLVGEGMVFDRSVYALIVDSQKLDPAKWPKTWSELSTHLKGKILIEDPRLSVVGMGWLRSIFEFHFVDLKSAKALTAQVFPNWSGAYAAFLKGEGVAVWSYLSSEAYHRCKEKSERYRALPLAEGYPVHEEWVAPIRAASASATTKNATKKFLDFLGSPFVQKELVQKNWMFPAAKSTPLPDCFAQLPQIKEAASTVKVTSKDVLKWLDQWSL